MILNERDKKILCDMNGFGVMTVRQVSESMNVVFTVGARRVRKFLKSGLIRRVKIPLMSVKPLCLTISGCRAASDSLPPIKGIRAAEIRHDLMVVDVAKAIVGRHGGQFIPVRRLRHSGYQAGQHLPDGLLQRPNRPDVAVELELTAKSEKRLAAILAEYAANLALDQVWYLTDDENIARRVRRLAKDQPHIRVGMINTFAKSAPAPNDTLIEDSHHV